MHATFLEIFVLSGFILSDVRGWLLDGWMEREREAFENSRQKGSEVLSEKINFEMIYIMTSSGEGTQNRTTEEKKTKT